MLTVSSVWAASSTLNWTDNSDNEDGFKIERRLGDTGVFAEVGSVGANVATFVDTTSDTQRYCYRVKAFNVGGDSGYSNIACGISIPASPSGLTITITISVTPTP